MLPTRRWLIGPAWPVIFMALATMGCRSGTAEVSGTVLFDAKPMPGGSVVMYCADGQIVRGLIGTDGRYSIPNVPRGPATVAVQAHARVPPGMQLAQRLPPSVDGPTPPAAEGRAGERVIVIPPRYSVPEESGLSLVVDGKGLTYDIHLTR